MSDSQPNADNFGSAELVLPGKPLSESMAFFTDDLGFRIDMIYPADAPRIVAVSGYGIRLRLDAGVESNPGTIVLKGNDAGVNSDRRAAPNGTTIEFAPLEAPLSPPEVHSSLVVTEAAAGGGLGDGRAGMR